MIKPLGITTTNLLNKSFLRQLICSRDWIRSDRMPEELRMEVHNILQETLMKTIPKVKKCKKGKWLSELALKIAEEKIEVEGKREKEM